MNKKVLSIISVMFISVSLSFAATTGSLLISGTVPEILEVTVLAAAGSTSLDLTQNVTDMHIGDVVERSNVVAGYTVTVSSANAATGTPHFKGINASNPSLSLFLKRLSEIIKYSHSFD